ncbi:MAG: hypothetical protein ACTHOH_05100 [Lysobacteraceae bacterium]
MITAEDAWTSLDAGFRRGEAAGAGAPLAQAGRGRGATMRIYWAGAAYWLEIDLRLRRDHGSSLQAVLDGYARCCLDGTAHVAPEAFVAALDRIAGTALFAPRYREVAASTDFPSLDARYAALGIVRKGNGLHFRDDAAAAALRDAIMRDTVRDNAVDAAPVPDAGGEASPR